MPLPHKSNIVIGIDPGTEITGYGVVAEENGRPRLLEGGIIRASKGELHNRLNLIFEELGRIIGEFKPDRMAVEQLYAHYKHPKTSIIMGHARGVILLLAARSNLELKSYPATEIKRSIAGNGRASKGKIKRMVTHLLSLKEEPEYDDISDALAAALTDIMHHNKQG
ncbi:MAG: crossover junction endodeoxyribonuclease RuvC [candidate division Zixibacteria bacterium]|nr:crossover junction endodeoxyribonuclease RuvC [candidate division Zixibacteria bacterium]